MSASGWISRLKKDLPNNLKYWQLTTELAYQLSSNRISLEKLSQYKKLDYNFVKFLKPFSVLAKTGNFPIVS